MSEKNSEKVVEKVVEKSEEIKIFEKIDSKNNVFSIATNSVVLDRHQRLIFNENIESVPAGDPYYILRVPAKKNGLNIASLEYLKELKEVLLKDEEKVKDLRKKVAKVKSSEDLKKVMKDLKEERNKQYFHLINDVISTFDEKHQISFTFKIANLSKQEIVAIINRMIIFEEN